MMAGLADMVGWRKSTFRSSRPRERSGFDLSMNYLRSPNLNKSLSLDGVPLDDVALAADRQNLVDQFNAAVGPPGEVVQAMQKDFVRGNMPFQEMVSYVRFCEYMIHAAQEKDDGSSVPHPTAPRTKATD